MNSLNECVDSAKWMFWENGTKVLIKTLKCQQIVIFVLIISSIRKPFLNVYTYINTGIV